MDQYDGIDHTNSPGIGHSLVEVGSTLVLRYLILLPFMFGFGVFVACCFSFSLSQKIKVGPPRLLCRTDKLVTGVSKGSRPFCLQYPFIAFGNRLPLHILDLMMWLVGLWKDLV